MTIAKPKISSNVMKGITNEEEERQLTTEPNVFMIGTITLPEPKNLNVVIFGAKIVSINFPHFDREIWVDNTPTCIIVLELDIACWKLPKDIQVRFFNSGTINNL
jgi:hypothetical protein